MQRPRDAWILILVVGAGSFLIVERALAATGNPGIIPSMLLLGTVTVPAAYAGLVGTRRLRYTVPAWTLGAGGVLGGGLGLGGAALMNHALGTPALVGLAVAEEATLLLLAAGALWVLPHRRVTDGLLLGTAIGVGFAIGGTVSLTITALADAGGTVDGDVHGVLVRGLLTPAAQMAWTGLAAAALWRAAQDGWTGPAVRRLGLVCTVVVVLHASMDAARSLPVTVIVTSVGFAMLVWFTNAAGPVSGASPASGSAPGSGAPLASNDVARPAPSSGAARPPARPRFPQPGPMPTIPPPLYGTAAVGGSSTARSAMDAPTHPLPTVPGP
jgi:hypothetical protein